MPYVAQGFLEKNKDELPSDAVQLFKDTQGFLQDCCAAFDAETTDVKKKKVTVASQFKTQLKRLMESISTTTPHYVRCLKPNDKNVPDEFVRKRVAEQLRYGGVLEAVRVARSGFPVRLPHAEFVRRYAALGPCPLTGDRKGCASLIEAFASDNRDAYQLGLTKVFLRKNAHDSLETARSSARRSAAVRLQSFVRRRQALTKVGSRLRAGRALSRWAFAALAILRVRSKRREWNALRVETAWRCARHRNRFRSVTRGVLALQNLSRGVGARRATAQRRRVAATVRIQSAYRMMRPRRFRIKTIHAITQTQAYIRRSMAKRAIQRMRSERADVANLQTEAEAMKEEIQQLRARAQQETLEREHAAVGAATAEVSRLRDELDAVLAVGDAKLRSAERLCSKLRGDGDRKAAAIDTLELRIADADARRDAAEARAAEAERLMKEEAQRAERLAEAAKDADAGLAQQLEAETARREEAEAALASLRSASPPPPVPPRAPAARAVVDAAHVTAQPGAAGRPGRRVPRGVAARRRGGGLGGRRERARPARAARGRAERAGRALRFGWSPAVLRRQEHVALPAPEAAAAPRASGALRRARRRRRRGGPRRPLHRPRGGGRRPVAAGGRPRVPDRERRRRGAGRLPPRPGRAPAPPSRAPVAASVAAAANLAATSTKRGHRGRRRRAREAAPPRAREQPEDDAPDARDAERRQPRLGEDRGIKTGDGGPAVAARRARPHARRRRAHAPPAGQAAPAAGLRQRGAPADVRRPRAPRAEGLLIVCVTFSVFHSG